MTDNLDTRAARNAYLLPYTNHTLEVYTYQLDRWLRWCADHSIELLRAQRTDVETYIWYLHQEVGHKVSSVHTALVPVRGFTDSHSTRNSFIETQLPWRAAPGSAEGWSTRSA